MVFYHGASIPGGRPKPVSRKTKKKQPKAPLINFSEDQVLDPELEPAVIKVGDDIASKELEENIEPLVLDKVIDLIQEEENIVEKELEVKIDLPKVKKVTKKIIKRRGRKKKSPIAVS